MHNDSGLDVEQESDTVIALHKAKVKTEAKDNIKTSGSSDSFPNHTMPVGYLDTIATLLDEYRILLKSARNRNHILTERIAILQEEAIKSAQREAIATHIAYHDGLTSLPNRRLLQDRFQQAISHADRQQKPLAILMLDLDKFKLVNDKLGHAGGDKLLQSVAARLTSSVRGADTACRFGGDEFAIMLPFIDSASSAGILASELGGRLSEPYSIDDHKIYMTISLGMAIYPEDGKTLDELVKIADAEMYSVKGMTHKTLIAANK